MGYVVKILVLCFVVGFALTTFDIRPAEILTNSWQTILGIYDVVIGFGEWALPYILVGAVVVVPLAIISAVLRYSRNSRFSRKSGSHHGGSHPGGQDAGHDGPWRS